MNRQELKTIERAYEAQGIDLQEEEATNKEIAALMTVVPDATTEQQGMVGGAAIWIAEDLFCVMIDLIQDVAPKLAVPFLLHYDTATELFLEPVLFRYIIQQGMRRGISVEIVDQLVHGMPAEYGSELLDVLSSENTNTPPQDPSQRGLDGL